MRKEGLTLIEVADGIDIEKDILANMEFKPILAKEIKKMDKNIFLEKPMGINLWEEMNYGNRSNRNYFIINLTYVLGL